MPYAFGLHPGVRLEPPGVATILFDAAEATDVPVIAPGGLFSSRRRPVDFDGRRLELLPDTFAREALCFVPARNRGLRLAFRDGSILRADYPGFDNLVLWSRPGAPFLCIEPWTGYGDPEDFAGEMAEKPGMRSLPPGAVATHGATFRFEPA
jgi:galactose mutarotase-like enzyme